MYTTHLRPPEGGGSGVAPPEGGVAGVAPPEGGPGVCFPEEFDSEFDSARIYT